MVFNLIVGLGNPGVMYSHTRHNIGWLVLDKLATSIHMAWTKSLKFNALIIKYITPTNTYIFLKPQTYMNLSGTSVVKAIHYFKINLDNVLIIHDDLYLDFLKIRWKIKGTAGGHNGIQNIIDCLNSDAFQRCKVGIRAQNMVHEPMKDFVLTQLNNEEQLQLQLSLPTIVAFIMNKLQLSL